MCYTRQRTNEDKLTGTTNVIIIIIKNHKDKTNPNAHIQVFEVGVCQRDPDMLVVRAPLDHLARNNVRV